MSNIQFYVQQLNSLSSNTAKSIIETATILVEAKQELSKDDYSAFLTQTKYDKDSSAIRKLEVIGNSQMRLKTVCHLLPASWTTIYKIAKLKVHEFDVLVEGNYLHPLTKAHEIEAATKNLALKPETMFISIKLDPQIDALQASRLIHDINQSIPSYLLKLKLSKNLQNLTKSSK